MIYNLKTKRFNDCYYRKINLNNVGKYVPPKWFFNFKHDLEEGYDVFTVETLEYPGEAQGVISLQARIHESTVYVKSIEAANHNKNFTRSRNRNDINTNRIYKGIGYNLVSFACQYSLEQGCGGHMYLKSKTTTTRFYTQHLKGEHLYEGSQEIVFDEKAGMDLAKTHFPGGAIQWLN
ncbi:hypothetical protein P4493_11030 [Bacillus thuringiensis]|uniref:Uncharacterized protein n=4 Tax=Bacillus thuringiensis TaxID=1428 RepID=A0AB35PB77_BACTU|nr:MULTISPECIES: hypothetical protein [Bacillus]EAO57374.1 hypothetical protein RBTH_07649 [Bacillus thuringiensis serovar israelensis ATCC 35646]AFQ30448.1 hypothetical protein BTF1_31742 [Bacillus thuringiensis HD-789]AJH02571.1 hypothetical protein AS86_6715 [Bacillus thuringiensis HD1002]AND28400.1 hypothetical protein ATN07_32235 [Bacillus thuringiensis serovar israelensis]EEM99477.1 hypothetical protein bthur0014_59830 [Bacillus thuringiensis IBL 4222]